MDIQVETRINAIGDLEPCHFRVGSSRLGVTEVMDRWLEPDRGYFKVVATDGAIYILRFDAGDGAWDVALYDSGRRPDTPTSPAGTRRQ